MIRKIVPYILWTLLSAGALVVSFMLGRFTAGSDTSALVHELDELKIKVSDAAVVKRVSRQMENIAYQQKEVSDQQRRLAEQQSELAGKMRAKAEVESRAARQAEQNARQAAAEAEYERTNALRHQQEAEQQRDAANHAKSVTDTLTYLTIGRTLGSMASDKYISGEQATASKMAYTGWFLMKKYGGNTYQNEIYKSLRSCSGFGHVSYTGKGGTVTALSPIGDGGCAAVTDYGEVVTEYPLTGQKTVLLHRKEYDFRGVYADGNFIYAISLHGPLLQTGFDSSYISYELPYGTYLGICGYDSEHLLISSVSSLLLFGTGSGVIEKQLPLEKPLSAVAVSHKNLYLFFTDGSSAIVDENFRIVPWEFRTEKTVTAVHAEQPSGPMFIGLDDGTLFRLDSDMKITEIMSGHSSRITCLLKSGDVLISTAYDRTVELVALSSRINFTSVSIPYQGWPLSLCSVEGGIVLIGTSEGSLSLLDVSTDSLAARIRDSGDYLLTDEEWTRYVGTGISYPQF